MAKYETDVLIVGGGLAGLCAAISAASNLSPTIIATKTLVGGATTTSIASGIISAITPFKEEDDGVAEHFADTLHGGCGVNDKLLARIMVNDASKYFSRLIKLGLEFETGHDGNPRRYSIPGHSKPRSYLMKGKGVRLQRILRDAAECLGTIFLERTTITSLVREGERVVGAVGFRADTSEAIAIRSKSVILATGGPGELFSRTLMPIGSTGYGCSLGLRAGAELVDMEFVQFYPTMVHEAGLPKIFIDYPPLLKHGGQVLNEEGVSIFEKHGVNEPWKLTRDHFSILIAKEMIGDGREKRVFFDCRGIKSDQLADSPALQNVMHDLLSKHVPAKERRFSVSPYAHYMMGGLRTDENGATAVPGLYAAGEAMGGPHGANRIGGNAFAAAVVFGFRSGIAASMYSSAVDAPPKSSFQGSLSALIDSISSQGELDAEAVKSSIQRLMWEKSGLLRNMKGLEKTLVMLNGFRDASVYSMNPVSKLLIPLMLDTAESVAASALLREESRGAHCRLDYPALSNDWGKKRITLRLHHGQCQVNFIPV